MSRFYILTTASTSVLLAIDTSQSYFFEFYDQTRSPLRTYIASLYTLKEADYMELRLRANISIVHSSCLIGWNHINTTLVSHFLFPLQKYGCVVLNVSQASLSKGWLISPFLKWFLACHLMWLAIVVDAYNRCNLRLKGK